jgi:putative ATPase
MLEAGEDPIFILRRMVILASEDIGNADPRALQVAVAALQGFQLVGLPEGRIIMGQAATYLATAPKSNASYAGIDEALREVRKSGALPVPMHIRNAPTGLMKDLGYGSVTGTPTIQERIRCAGIPSDEIKDRNSTIPPGMVTKNTSKSGWSG